MGAFIYRCINAGFRVQSRLLEGDVMRDRWSWFIISGSPYQLPVPRRTWHAPKRSRGASAPVKTETGCCSRGVSHKRNAAGDRRQWADAIQLGTTPLREAA
jgi:hypothetical protein